LIVFNLSIYSQKNQQLTLKIISKDSLENSFIKNIEYIKKHTTKNSIKKEVNSTIEQLKRTGFFTLQIDSTKITLNTHSYYTTLNSRIKRVRLKINPTELLLSRNYRLKQKNTIEIKTEELTQFIKDLQSKIENNGEAFGKINLENLHIKNGVLFTDLTILHAKKRTLDSIVLKGYTKIPRNLYKNLISAKKKFTKNSIKEVSNIITNSKFIEETKTPEVLFSKDSTILYLYLKKVNSNSFDGLINFSTNQETNNIELKGYLDLKLNNTLNLGEQLNLNWKNNGDNKQDLNINSTIPYFLGTKLNINANFNLYRQDTTFTNTNSSIQITHPISKNSSLGLIIASKNSSELQNQSNSGIQDFTKKEIGFIYQYKNGFTFNLHTSFGKRSNDNQAQLKFNISASYQLSNKLQLHIKNTTALLSSKNYFENELYRIGGTNSIRGFNEQSILAAKYSYFNTEFRFTTNTSTYIYTILDFGKVTRIENTQELLGLGLGYSITNKQSQINISYNIGKFSNQAFDLDQSKVSIKMLTFF